MHPIDMTYKSNTELTGASTIKILARRNSMNRLIDSFESADWEEKIRASERWLNKICLSVLVLSATYFISVLALR